MSKSPREVAEEYWRAEASRNVESVLAMYRRDAEFYPVTGVLKGHDEIRTFYDGMGDTFPGLEVETVHEIFNGDEASLEWKAVLIAQDGTQFPIRGANIIEVSGDLILRMRSYFDPTQFPTPAVSK